MSKLAIGTRVQIMGGGMKEFRRKTGTVIENDYRDGNVRMYRVRLDEPVTIVGVGEVNDDLWAGRFLKRERMS